MGEKQLDFNQPLLSVRRFTSSTVSKVEEKRKPKSLIAKLPPLPAYKSKLKSGPVANPGTVPFTWEQSPGRPKNEGKLQNQESSNQLSWNAPKLPPGRNRNVNLQGLSRDLDTTTSTQLKKINALVPSAQNGIPKKEVSRKGHRSNAEETIEEGSLGLENGDEVFLDAHDTLSRSDSFFLNCSISGLSGVNGPNEGSSGRLSMDPQIQDFMMSRFLPAAKAMALEAPAHVPRKQQLAREQLSQVKKVVYVNKKHPLYQYKPYGLSNSTPYPVGFESEEDESYQPRSPSIKNCGLFPWFSLRNSFCVLKDMPRAQMQAVEPVSSSRKQQFKSSHMLRGSEIVSQHAAIVDEEKYGYGCCPSSLPKQKLEPKVKSSQTSTTKLSDEPPKVDALFGNRDFLEQSRSLGIHYAAKDSTRVDNFISQRKPCTTFRDLLAQDARRGELESTDSAPEKTVYVDAVHKLRSQDLDTGSSDTKIILGYSRELSESNGTGEKIEDVKFIDTLDEKEPIGEMGMVCIAKNIKDSYHGYVIEETITDTHDEESYNNVKTDSVKQWIEQSSDQEKPYGNTLTFLIPPLLPKSPAESWLSRTLPSLSSKNSSASLSLGLINHNRMQALKPLYPNSKCERIVETSSACHDTTRHSEKLLEPIQE